MVIESAKTLQSRRELPLFSLHKSEQQYGVQDELLDSREDLQGNIQNTYILRPNLEAAFLKLTTIEEELHELKKIISDYDFRRHEKVPLTLLQANVLEALTGKRMTAGEVAKIVNRTRPLLVINLHQMVALGLLEEEREGMRVYFKRRDVLSVDQRTQR